MRVALAGAGAFGLKHLDALTRIDGVEIAAVVSRRLDQAREVRDKYGAPLASTELEEVLASPDGDAVILATPTQMHAAQAIATLRAGKHVQVEIPLADSWSDAEAVAATQRDTGLVCMVGHTRRFNPSHQWIHRRIVAGELTVLQMDVQTYFFRRTNMNALGQPRSWTDNLLWHHAAHTVDLFAYQCDADIVISHALAGPIDRIFVLDISDPISERPIRSPLDVVIRAFAISRDLRYELEIQWIPEDVQLCVLPAPVDDRDFFDFSDGQRLIDEAYAHAVAALDELETPAEEALAEEPKRARWWKRLAS